MQLFLSRLCSYRRASFPLVLTLAIFCAVIFGYQTESTRLKITR